MAGGDFYNQYSNVCQTIVNPVRQRIIEEIGTGSLNVSEIQKKLNISMSNLSNHLSILYNVGVLNKKKDGNYIFYYLSEPRILGPLREMKEIVSSIMGKKSRQV